MAEVRLQKFLSECGVASRRASEQLIRAGKVKVNAEIVRELGTKIDPDHDQISVRNKIVKPPPKGILLFNKPKGVISTLVDPDGRPTIADYLTKHYQSYYPVGRLDYESTGLMILTNDGDLAQHLLHPKFELPRVYHARIAGRMNERTMRKLEQGVRLEDGVAKADRINFVSDDKDSTWIEVEVREGRNRLIRRMMEKVHHPVMKLRRVSHGPFKLGKLQPGHLRKLTDREYDYFRRKVLGEQAKERRRPARSNSRAQKESPDTVESE